MKKMIVAFALVAFTASFTSCKKCVECTHPVYSDTDEYCGGDAIQRNLYQDQMEAGGYNCSKK